MTIADDNTDAYTDKKPVGKESADKKLEKSLDAIAALRQAMEQRLAAHAAEVAAVAAREQPAASAPEPMPPETPPLEAAPSEPVAVEPESPPPAAATVTPEAAAPEAVTQPEQTAKQEEKTPPQPEPQAQAEPKAAPASDEATPHPDPIAFDPVQWSRILLHVTERSRELIFAYIGRMQKKPIDLSSFSPTPMLESLSELAGRLANDPEAFTHAQVAAWQNSLDLTRAALLRMQGMKMPQGASTERPDKRFSAKDWQNNWMFDLLKQGYLNNAEQARKMVQHETANIDKKLARKIEFYTRLFLDATSPSNFWLTNPEVLRATLDSNGENLIKGLENLLEDLERGNGSLQIRMSDYHSFELGKNIATTPGQVVYQNELMQLIQYAPSTPTVHKVPLLIVPPWINKFYILDLREKNSFIRYLVSQGHTVFCISWVNPTKRHALTQFEDYVDTGILQAMAEIKRITGEDKLNTVGYCIGGTALACTRAYLAALAESGTKPRVDLPEIASATSLVTMVDFANPGDLGVFIDEDQIRMLEDRMARQGYMDAGSMMLTFNLLRANDLIWPFVINNYLLGREPFPFDILYWNTDSTNLPAAMQSYYLRKMYLDNKLIEPNALKMKGVPIDLGTIKTPSFVLATRDDHIAPWRSTYAATQQYQGPVTFVLSGSGHIAGVVNPPTAEKYGYWTNEAPCPQDPEAWVMGAHQHKGSWWPEWMKWLEPYAGEDVAPREVVNGIEPAPGSYVKVRAV